MYSPDDDAPETSPSSPVYAHGHVGPEELNCAGPYDAERTAGGILLAARTVTMPHGWRLDEAVAEPLSLEWHEPVIARMLFEQVVDEDGHRSYLMRQSVLVWSVYNDAPCSEETKKGAAYGLLHVGLESHKFRPRPGGHHARHMLVSPPVNLFELLAERGGVDALHLLLQDGWIFIERSH